MVTGRAEYRLASDGHKARVAPTWSEEKLRILACYLNGFAKACTRAGGWYALDLFAGGGLNISETTGAEIPGSPLIALGAHPPLATRVICCETGQRNLKALDDRVGPYRPRVEIYPGNANELIGALLERVPPRAPAFAFLDPEGAELQWETVRAVAAHKRPPAAKVEQLILFPTDTGFVRLLSLRKPLNPSFVGWVTAMFGTDEWAGIFERRRRGTIDGEQAREEYLALYAGRLKRELGYQHVQERQIRREPSKPRGRGRSMYFLLHATDKDAGESIMGHCFDKKHMRPEEELGQLAQVHTPVAPRKRRVL